MPRTETPPAHRDGHTIVPRAVAEGVWEEAFVWLDEELPRKWLDSLATRANTHYARNPRFRQLLQRRGNAGRDWLWAFTRHWLAAQIWKHRPELHARLPERYSVGDDLPGCPFHVTSGMALEKSGAK